MFGIKKKQPFKMRHYSKTEYTNTLMSLIRVVSGFYHATDKQAQERIAKRCLRNFLRFYKATPAESRRYIYPEYPDKLQFELAYTNRLYMIDKAIKQKSFVSACEHIQDVLYFEKALDCRIKHNLIGVLEKYKGQF
jgi:hypothetical protein